MVPIAAVAGLQNVYSVIYGHSYYKFILVIPMTLKVEINCYTERTFYIGGRKKGKIKKCAHLYML